MTGNETPVSVPRNRRCPLGKTQNRSKVLSGVVQAVQKRGFRVSSWSILSKPKQLSTITVMTYGKWMLEAGRKVKADQQPSA